MNIFGVNLLNMRIGEITAYLEEIAPLSYQESYDNAGLIVGHPSDEIESVLVCLDSPEAVVDEAIEKGCGLIIAHHPIVFSGLKRFNGTSYIERVVMKAIRHNIAIYAIHTNLDNVLEHGVNSRICEQLGIQNPKILSMKEGRLQKLVVFCPHKHAEAVRSAMFKAGAGNIGDYKECSYNLEGTGTFKATGGADPFVGKKGERHEEPEVRVEVIVPDAQLRTVLAAMNEAHPYEVVAYDVYKLENRNQELGAGMVGTLEQPMEEMAFLKMVKAQMKAGVVRYTALRGKPVETVAVCGGSGSFLLGAAKRAKADVFITADYKYHQFFDAEEDLVIADIGHYESEQYTIDLLAGLLTKKFTTFAVHLTSVNTNPINYL